MGSDTVFSHSRLSTYETCPRQYRYRYLDLLPVDATGAELHVGSVVHAVLERVYGAARTGRVPDLPEARRWFDEEWGRVPAERLRIVRPGFVVEDYRGLGLSCLEDYMQRHAPFTDGETIAVEQQVDIDLGEGTRLVGYIDRVVRQGPGVYEIHDYKTSGSWPRPRDLDADRQLSLYEMGIRQLHPDVREVLQVWHYLALQRRFERRRTAADLERVRAACRRLIARVREERTWPARPGVLCHWCDYRAACPEGSAHADAHPLTGSAE